MILFGIFVLTIILAALFAIPFQQANLQAFENPEDPGNAVWYVVLILAFTFVILWIARKKIKWLIRGIILFAVGSTIAYVVGPLLAIYVTHGPYWMSDAILGPGYSLDLMAIGLALAVAIGSVVALYKHPEWYVIDTVGILVAAGSAAIFGISFGIVPVILLLALLAIYDAIAVYRTKHMLSLADTVIDLRLPVLLVIPKHAGYHFREEAGKFKEASAENKGERDAMFMGLGDLVMPTMLVVSALQFSSQWGGSSLPAACAAVGTLAGFVALMGFVLRGNPQAGLPLLNGGSIAGFLVGLYAITGSVKFW